MICFFVFTNVILILDWLLSCKHINAMSLNKKKKTPPPVLVVSFYVFFSQTSSRSADLDPFRFRWLIPVSAVQVRPANITGEWPIRVRFVTAVLVQQLSSRRRCDGLSSLCCVCRFWGLMCVGAGSQSVWSGGTTRDGVPAVQQVRTANQVPVVVLDSVHDDVKLQLCVCISAVWRQRPACCEPCACSSETELLWDPWGGAGCLRLREAPPGGGGSSATLTPRRQFLTSCRRAAGLTASWATHAQSLCCRATPPAPVPLQGWEADSAPWLASWRPSCRGSTSERRRWNKEGHL